MAPWWSPRTRRYQSDMSPWQHASISETTPYVIIHIMSYDQIPVTYSIGTEFHELWDRIHNSQCCQRHCHNRTVSLCANTNTPGCYRGTTKRTLMSLNIPHTPITLFIVFSLCGDIKTNPDPTAYKDNFPCGFCEIKVDWSDAGFVVTSVIFGTIKTVLVWHLANMRALQTYHGNVLGR